MSMVNLESSTKKGVVVRNKVHFAPLSIEAVLDDVLQHNRLSSYEELLRNLRDDELNEQQFQELFNEAKRCVPQLETHFTKLVDQLLSVRWLDRSEKSIETYKEFVIELSIVHKKFCTMIVTKLLNLFIPNDDSKDDCKNGVPSSEQQQRMSLVHDLIMRLKSVIPMIFDVVLTELRNGFPYLKKPTYEVIGYVFNILTVMEYSSIYCEELMDIIFHQLIKIDVNMPRSEIESAEYPDEGAMFEMDIEVGDNGEEDEGKESQTMRHPLAETLDCFMDLMFNYIEETVNSGQGDRLFKIMLNQFESHILPTHNTDHVQFLLFYICSFKLSYAEHFISCLWKNVSNPNMSPTVRQASVGYIASMLARAKFLPLSYLKTVLFEMSLWTQNYIQRIDMMQFNQSLKVHLVFYSVCQAIFYVVAFRSKHLTSTAKNLSFLQSLQLSSIVTCQLNPLRVCLPTVATAFAGITRAYQLAYCHTILERNARRKLATVYNNSTQLPEECLDTFFPFDPYMLKKSGLRIEPLYLQYQAHEMDEVAADADPEVGRRRNRYESMSEDVDDFIPETKRHRNQNEHTVDMKHELFSYGVSPGFHA